jgi:hypothetical protein
VSVRNAALLARRFFPELRFFAVFLSDRQLNRVGQEVGCAAQRPVLRVKEPNTVIRVCAPHGRTTRLPPLVYFNIHIQYLYINTSLP